MHLVDPLVVATPVFLVALIADMLYARRFAPSDYETRDIAASMSMGLGSVILGLLFGFVTLDLAEYLAAYRTFNIGWSVGAVMLCFVLDDLTYYCRHRTAYVGCGRITCSITPASISISRPRSGRLGRHWALRLARSGCR